LVRLNDENGPKFLGFQVKADDELPTPGIYSLLKAQHFDAFSHYGDDLLHYFILPCVDYSDTSKHDAVRRVCSDFAATERTTVIEPPFVWNFLYETSRVALEALTSAFISDDDPLHREALLSITGFSPSQRLMLLYVVAQDISDPDQPLRLNELLTADGIDSIATPADWWDELALPDSFRLPIEFAASDHVDPAMDLDILEAHLETDENGTITLQREGLEALLAFGYDGWARYGHQGRDLVEYLQRSLVSSQSKSEWDLEGLADLVVLAKRISNTNAVKPMALLCEANFSEPADVLEILGKTNSEEMTWMTVARAAVSKLRYYWN